MPLGDRTGPEGRGPMTGRRRGFCAGFDEPGFTDFGRGFGGRFKRGFGVERDYGMRRFVQPSLISKTEEKEML